VRSIYSLSHKKVNCGLKKKNKKKEKESERKVTITETLLRMLAEENRWGALQ
jgi:hypothetical protein